MPYAPFVATPDFGLGLICVVLGLILGFRTTQIRPRPKSGVATNERTIRNVHLTLYVLYYTNLKILFGNYNIFH